MRFGIKSQAGLCSATWKLWTQTTDGKSDVYLACRALGGIIKASLHETGEWHIAFSNHAFNEQVRGAIPTLDDRFVEKWPRPTEIFPGVTLAFRIVTPCWAVSSPAKEADLSKVKFIPNSPESKANEIFILLTKPAKEDDGWPGKTKSGTELVGKIQLESGETLWAVYRVIDMPEIPNPENKAGYFLKGKQKSDLRSSDLRGLFFGEASDGSRVIYDCPVCLKETTV